MTDTMSNEQGRDWRVLNLAANGQSLIEASAGTGKTWTITALYLRFLLEQKLTPKQIVVTTFTNAAAEELRAKLRARLIDAEKHASEQSDNQEHDDSAILWLKQRWQQNPQAKQEDLQRLRLALTELDMAPVATLHGLCQRILSDYPFAAGALFKPDELVSGESLFSELAKDLQRLLFQGKDEPLQILFRQSGEKLSSLTKKVGLLLQPGRKMNCRSDEDIRKDLPIEWSKRLRELCAVNEYFTANSTLQKYWLNLSEIIENPIDAELQLKTIRFGVSLEALLTDEASWKAKLKIPGKTNPEILEAIDFSKTTIVSGVLKYLQLHKARAFWSAVADWAKAQASSRMAAQNQRSFDDLLSTVHSVLYSSDGQALADALFNSWPVALVDEFQDTDSIQYGILQRIYRNSDHTKRGRLIMIGDPKQAIYRFRGGDINAYLRAKDEVDTDGHLTLGVNHRSSKQYVGAVNEFYELFGSRLSALEGSNLEDSNAIEYQEVAPSSKHDGKPYLIEANLCERPLVIHYSSDVPESAGQRKDLALEICANQIQAMLSSGTHRIGDKPLTPADIAVLLPANSQVRDLRDLLNARNVPCVTMARSSVFATETAKELQIILFAVVHRNELSALRAAVATRLWGLDYATIREMGDDPNCWQELDRIYHSWHELWQKQGLQSVINALIDKVGAEQLNGISGERVLTDLRHLGELLQAQSSELVGIEELLVWFSDQRKSGEADDEDAAESAQLRIESDAKRVRLMTLHASKGLEFPIVFLPLMWAHDQFKSFGISQISTDEGEKLLDVDEASKTKQNEELQDERFRVLYVAMTRAEHACHMLALPHDRPKEKDGDSPTVGTVRSALDVMLSRLPPPIDCQKLNGQSRFIEWIPQWVPNVAAKNESEQALPSARLARELPKLRYRALPSKHSFSTLMKKYEKPALEQDMSAEDETDLDAASVFELQDVEQVASDETSIKLDIPHTKLQALELVRGKDFGNAVHSIFENRDLSKPLGEQHNLIQQFLAQNNVKTRDGHDEAWLTSTLSTRLQTVLDTRLADAHQNGPRLADLRSSELRAEMEFHYSLDAVSLNAMRKVCTRYGEAELVPDNPRTLSGLMNGKIDLTFYYNGRYHVLDYKGNYLGNCLSDYVGDALRVAMDHSHYRFQALLYMLAVDRYLSQRINGYNRKTQLGDCYYLFIRAVGLGEGTGIWHHRYDDDMLADLQDVLSSVARKDAA